MKALVIRYIQKGCRLTLGMVVSTLGIVMMLQANIGLDPWNIFHQGISLVTGVSFGTVTILVGAAVVLLAILLGSPLGVGTLVNIFGCGILIDFYLEINLFAQQTGFWPGLAMLLGGLELLALGTYLYMSSGMGNGPRDSLMVAFKSKTPLPVGFCRSSIELAVTLCGWLMGGKAGLGTILSAVGIGVFLQANFALFRFRAEEVHQETLLETWRILTHKATVG